MPPFTIEAAPGYLVSCISSIFAGKLPYILGVALVALQGCLCPQH